MIRGDIRGAFGVCVVFLSGWGVIMRSFFPMASRGQLRFAELYMLLFCLYSILREGGVPELRPSCDWNGEVEDGDVGERWPCPHCRREEDRSRREYVSSVHCGGTYAHRRRGDGGYPGPWEVAKSRFLFFRVPRLSYVSAGVKELDFVAGSPSEGLWAVSGGWSS